LYRHSYFRFSFIFRYFKIFQMSQMFTGGLSDLLSCGRFVGCFCIARILVSFITYVLSITCYCILYILYICISLYLVKLWWFIENKRYILKKAIDQYIHDTIFQIWHNLCSELTSILAIQKQPTNRPQLNKSDRPPVNIWDI
jgi:hypothetical protein